MECGFGSDWDGDMDGEGHLSLGGLGCVVVGEGRVDFSDMGDHFIVTNGLEPLWGGKVLDFGDPNLITEAADGRVEWRKPGGEV